LEAVSRKECDTANAPDAHPHGQPCCSCAACSSRESCIDKSSPTFARPAYTGVSRHGVAVLRLGFSWLTGTLMVRRVTAASCGPRLRDRLDTADGNLPEKSAINADAHGWGEGREVTRKRNILPSKYGERRAAMQALGRCTWTCNTCARSWCGEIETEIRCGEKKIYPCRVAFWTERMILLKYLKI